MTTVEILQEIRKLPVPKQVELAVQLRQDLPPDGLAELKVVEVEQREDEFERYLLADGLIGEIPRRIEYDDEEEFELLELEGEPLSEQIIRERI